MATDCQSGCKGESTETAQMFDHELLGIL